MGVQLAGQGDARQPGQGERDECHSVFSVSLLVPRILTYARKVRKWPIDQDRWVYPFFYLLRLYDQNRNAVWDVVQQQ
jgi:hypothetical protein